MTAYSGGRYRRHRLRPANGGVREIIASGIFTNPVKLNAFLGTVGKAATVDQFISAHPDWVARTG